ncbi:MAG: GNAT family N-acetyltransferase [Desulfarculaceae bacterium]|jgi:ribosomal protein S18 acetylase RimI-like enzyme
MTQSGLTWRTEPESADVQAVERLAADSGFFNPAEVAIARELVQERLAKGNSSGYLFLFAEEKNRILGYACYGPIAGTKASWDLFWIVVERTLRSQGIGDLVLCETEKRAAQQGADRLYVETSSREQYGPTRGFYMDRGYAVEAVLRDFYASGDDKIIFVKMLS